MGLKRRRLVKSGVLCHLPVTVGVPVCLQMVVFLFVSFVCVQATVDPTSFACTTYNSTVIEVSWSMATDASVAGYYLYLQRTDGLKTQEGPGITLPSRNYISYTFYGLSYYAQYDISINSYSNLGTNNTVYTQTCTTLSGNPDLSNFNLSCEGISFYEISCTWGSLDAVYWNGVPYGWQLGYISYYNDEYTYIHINTTATLTYTIQSLQFDTKYLINIRSVNTGGFMGPYSSTNSKTLGLSSNTENATRYFCYEAIPGYLEFGWLEMPCTIYSGTIAGLLLISLLLLMLCCCMCCCKGGGKNNSNTEINIFNEERNEYYGDDDDEDDFEKSEEEEVASEEGEEEEDKYDDMSDGHELDKAPAIEKKKKLSDDEVVEESEEELEETDDDDEDSETGVEIYACLTEDEKKGKKEERAAAKKEKKEEKEKKREEAKKRKEEEKKRKEEERKEKIRERMKQRNSAMAGAATLKTVDETKKEKKTDQKARPTKKKASESEDDESEGYYEDWNPDADENPDVEVNKVSNMAVTPNGDRKGNTKDKIKNKTKEKRDKSAKNKDKKGRKSVNKKHVGEDSEADDEDYEDEDDETDEEEYDSSDEEDNKTSSEVVKAKSGKKPRKDSGRGSASSNNSVGEKQDKTNKSDAKSCVTFKEGGKEQKKRGGFLSNLFGTSKSKESNANAYSRSKTTQVQQSGKEVDYGDWDDDDTEFASSNDNAGNNNSNTINKDRNLIGVGSKGYTSKDNKSTINGIPLNNCEGNVSIHAPVFVNSGPYKGRNTQRGSLFQNNDNEMPPPGYGRNPNGTFHPLAGNFNRNVPQGFIRNSDDLIQKHTSNRQDYANTNNNPPPGYAKNFDGSFYPVRGNTNPVVPQGFIRNPDGTIYHYPQSYRADNESSHFSNPPPGFGKNPDGTFYPLPGNGNPVLPLGYARNHDGTIYRASNQAPYTNSLQNGLTSNEPPPGYNKNPEGTFYPKPGNRHPIIPPGYTHNQDGSIYRPSGTNYQNNQSNTTKITNVLSGYVLNKDGTYRPLPGNMNTVIPPGFAKDNRGNMYPANFTGDGENIFAPKQNNHQNQDGDPTATAYNSFGNKKINPYDNTVGTNKNSYGNPLGTNQIPHDSAVEPNQTPYDHVVGTNQIPNGNAVGNNLNTSGYPFVVNRNPFGNQVRRKHNANDNLKGKTNSQVKHQQPGQNQPNDPHDQSATTENAGPHRNPLNGANHTYILPTGSNDFRNQQNALEQNGRNNYLPSNINGTRHGQPNEVNTTSNPVDLDSQGYNLRGNPSKREGRHPFSFGHGKQADTDKSNGKPISFRDIDHRYEEYKQRHPNQDEDLHDSQPHPQHDRIDNFHQNTKNIHRDASDTEVLLDDGPPNKRRPIARFRGVNQTPAWGSKPDKNDNVERSGKHTPITELTRQDRQELIEPEPVLGSDRLGNKFPFLNIDKKRQLIAAGNEGDKKDGQNPENRRKSESEMVLRGRELVDKKDLPKRDFPPLPNTLTGEAAAIAISDDLAGLKQETRAQIFYGFGVGRWRQAAAKWLTKLKMKKEPVKTAKASWD